MKTTTTTVSDETATAIADGYDELLSALRDRFAAVTADDPKLFTTTATGLFEAFLGELPEDRRQHYTCNSCRHFVDRYGGLVTLDPGGKSEPVFWNPSAVPPFFRDSIRKLRSKVIRSRVTGVFMTEGKTWGFPQNQDKVRPIVWHHLAVKTNGATAHIPPQYKTPHEAIAEKLEEFGMLGRGLAEFDIEIARQALALLTGGNLYRSDKHIGVGQWLLGVYTAIEGAKGQRRHNLLWRFVASAPVGWCHIKTGMLGTLLDDVKDGLAFDTLKRRFEEKMHGLAYQRPQAAPSAGNIKQAEKLVEKMGIANSLKRRFAKLEDLQLLWAPEVEPEPERSGDGVFDHLTPKGKAERREIDQPSLTMTWVKFRAEVLPEALEIELRVPSGHDSFTAMVTAADPEAPPILQWDREEKRNPVSWYLYSGGSFASRWNLSPGIFTKVTGIALQPSMWADEEGMKHQERSLFVILEGCRDTSHESGGGLFPESLRSELHEVRATIEAYTKRAEIAGRDEATGCGLKLESGRSRGRGNWNCTIRVKTKLGLFNYHLDRWD